MDNSSSHTLTVTSPSVLPLQLITARLSPVETLLLRGARVCRGTRGAIGSEEAGKSS